MSTIRPAAGRCGDLVGMTEVDLIATLGAPAARRVTGADTWLVFELTECTIRARCAGSSTSRVASWTATFRTGTERLRDAAEILGLWPAAGPDEEAAACQLPLIRRALSTPLGQVHSLTATIRGGLITAVSVFDEAPEWT